MEQHGNGLLPTCMVSHIRYHGFCSDLSVSGGHFILDQLKLNPSKTELLVIPDNTQTTSPMIQNTAVVLEELVVLEDLPDTSSALAYLFGLLYALNFSYPKDLSM
ncbi:hypothetical protein QTP70_000275 [Hemibagrus guttatus]|uniref:Uncharacterized protein n=1 Tax=Hemibagrus guttatus TaxID=175788 RepID=A0AAE0PQP3_9TELE|nr:hypothetical protein QTP70_000275 [Hemibagrus guttatus]